MTEILLIKPEPTKIEVAVTKAFLKVETVVYMALGVLLAFTTLLAIASAGLSLWEALEAYGSADSLIGTIDRLLFVVMLVEILHTVRVSFSSRKLVCEPFLIVGLIASIRQILVITLKSSQSHQANGATTASTPAFDSTMLELGMLAGLILVMVLSIYLLRRSDGFSRKD